jgi:hypothetical protein
MRTKHQNRVLEQLAEWLLRGGSVSWPKLDSFRRRLKLADEAFAALLGVRAGTYRGWRRTGVPRRGRANMHKEVLRPRAADVRVQNLSEINCLKTGEEPSRTPHFRVLVPSRATPAVPTFENSPHLFIPLSEAQRRRNERYRAEHGSWEPRPATADLELIREIGGDWAVKEYLEARGALGELADSNRSASLPQPGPASRMTA